MDRRKRRYLHGIQVFHSPNLMGWSIKNPGVWTDGWVSFLAAAVTYPNSRYFTWHPRLQRSFYSTSAHLPVNYFYRPSLASAAIIHHRYSTQIQLSARHSIDHLFLLSLHVDIVSANPYTPVSLPTAFPHLIHSLSGNSIPLSSREISG